MPNVGPFNGDELVRWAETYGDPEDWAKRAQAAHTKAEHYYETAVRLQNRVLEISRERDRYRQALERIASSEAPLDQDDMQIARDARSVETNQEEDS